MSKALTIKDYMSAPQVQTKMKEMLQSPELIRQFTTSVISIAGADELLAVAEPRSLFNACLTAASLNLPINKNLGFAHIIGYRNNRKNITEAQFQLGARGFKELAQRSGQYSVIHSGDVREGELVGRNRLTGQMDFQWIDNDEERMKKPVVGYFSFFRLQNGFESTLYMSVDELKAHGKRYSQSYKKNFGPWVDNFEAMCLKTVSKLNISKNGPLSIDMQKAINVDQAVVRGDDKFDYVDGEEDLSNVKADDDKKAAILAANAEEGEVVESPKKDPAAEVGEVFEGAEDVTPKPKKEEKPKSVKEKAAEWSAKRKSEKSAESKEGEQGSLIDDKSS